MVSRNSLERGTIEGESPVGENHFTLLATDLEYLEAKTTSREAGSTNCQG